MWLSHLANLLGLEYTGEDLFISGVNNLESAQGNELSFLADSKYSHLLQTTRAGAVVVSEEHSEKVSRALVSKNPYLDFTRAMEYFACEQGLQESCPDQAFIHPSARVDPTAIIHPMAFIGAGAEIGPECRIFPHVYIGENVKIGQGCKLYPQVSLMADVVLGSRVIVHAGTVIGSDGFGYVQDGETRKKVPQMGKVVVEDDVEIGAGTTIDRATLGETRICRNTKIDNLVQIAHNVQVGENCVLISQVGISGSTSLGKNVVLGGQVGIAGHLRIEDNCRVAAKSGVGKSLPANTDAGGIPAMDHSTFLRNSVLLPKLSQMHKRLKQLEKAIQDNPRYPQGDDQ